METPQLPVVPPRWTETVVRVALPDDAMRDAIVGDLHEEFAQDAAQLGPADARARHRRRAAGIVAHAVVDALCWRAWVSTTPPVEGPRADASPSAPVPHGAAAGRSQRSPARVGGADVGIGALAFGVLLLGVVGNTVLFAAARHAPRAAAGGPSLGSAIGAGAVVLALACAGVAALVLCVGPRWLRRRCAPPREPAPAGYTPTR